jgi:hypothetical protein
MTANQHRIYGVVSGACFIAIIQLATRQQFGAAHLFSLCCFATSLPFMALGGAMAEVDNIPGAPFLGKLAQYLIRGSLPVFWVGMVALLFSFGWLAAGLFAVGSVIAVAIAMIADRRSN